MQNPCTTAIKTNEILDVYVATVGIGLGIVSLILMLVAIHILYKIATLRK